MTENGFQFQDLQDGSVRLTGWDGKADELVIPEKIGDRKVTEIGPMAFSKNETLRQVTVPKEIRVIRHNAFSSCTNLEKVVLQSGVMELGDFAFNNCPKVTYIMLPSTLKKIGLNALPEKAALVVGSYSPLIHSLNQSRIVYWDGSEPSDELETKVAKKQKSRAKISAFAVCVYSGFLLFGMLMMVGLFIKNTQMLIAGWIGMAFFGVIMAIMIKKGK